MKNASNTHRYAVIMAGGSGTRLWPLSRKERPKQFHKLVSSKTLLEETFDRVARVVDPQNIFISTTQNYKDLALQTLPKISAEHIIVEPAARGTAPAIALVTETLASKDTKAIVATIASDHVIKNPEEFTASLETAFTAAEKHPEKLATIGINPVSPSTEFGYIKMGKELETLNEKRIFSIAEFKEKPDEETAKKYLADWAYLWNAGYFIFSAETLLAEMKQHIPKTMHIIETIVHNGIDEKKLNGLYTSLENEPFDTAVLEKMAPEKRVVVPSAMEWDDIGNWNALFEFLKKDHRAELIAKGNHIDAGSKNCFVYGGNKLVATIGLKDMIIIETDDVVLVANKNRAHEVKKIIGELKAQGKHLYL